jgi:hypothetical protein
MSRRVQKDRRGCDSVTSITPYAHTVADNNCDADTDAKIGRFGETKAHTDDCAIWLVAGSSVAD